MARKAAPVPETPRLSQEELTEAMRLIKGADSVELKVTIPVEAHRATIQGLPMDPVEAQPRQVFFFDTPDLALNKVGVVVRARRIQGGRGDTVIKLRPVVPADLSAELRQRADFNVEVDLLPGGFVCSASFKGRSDGVEVRNAVAGLVPLGSIYSKAQRKFFAEHAPEGVDLDSLLVLGPTFVLKGRFAVKIGLSGKDVPRQLVAEMWLYPDGSRILELSTRCRPAKTFQVAGEMQAYLSGRGVTIGGLQQTKTKTALEFFAAHIKEGGA